MDWTAVSDRLSGRFLAVGVALAAAATGFVVADGRTAVFVAVAAYFLGKTAGSVRRTLAGPTE